MANEKVKEYLNTLVATQGLFYVKLHQAHWYIKGPNFFSLHPKLEELYDDLTVQMDDMAERLLAIGGEPYSTLKEFIDHSLIKESIDDKNLSEKEMIQSVITDFEILRDELSSGIKLTDEENDGVSNDLLISQKTEVDKTIWMLQAYMGHSALEDKK
ncbi:starvation-inducible DNA-binding protein [Marinilactibacillus piezotolerans]|uniref:Starvation-inducible DNA-binding protein n=1 Tax=Marinilactibacillus piezotolerans TaxID=258723 RepID=A0A1I3W9B3_9LACT|nr:DNA starvation/stationary phase protection protein [Marinilactibacillus piezotolerans]SFK04085.1 starvation-inducible DNA-binding protein [Marinilactibacillus piezotolerans]